MRIRARVRALPCDRVTPACGPTASRSPRRIVAGRSNPRQAPHRALAAPARGSNSTTKSLIRGWVACPSALPLCPNLRCGASEVGGGYAYEAHHLVDDRGDAGCREHVVCCVRFRGAQTSHGQGTQTSSRTVLIQDFRSKPAHITIRRGTKVRWINKDSTAHTATANNGRSFNSGRLGSGRRYSHTFRERGRRDTIARYIPI
jgi:plastocyanin